MFPRRAWERQKPHRGLGGTLLERSCFQPGEMDCFSALRFAKTKNPDPSTDNNPGFPRPGKGTDTDIARESAWKEPLEIGWIPESAKMRAPGSSTDNSLVPRIHRWNRSRDLAGVDHVRITRRFSGCLTPRESPSGYDAGRCLFHALDSRHTNHAPRFKPAISC